VFIYGEVCYAIFFVTLLYAVGFPGNFGVPKTIDSGAEAPLAQALLLNCLLLAGFAVQHSVMARPWFKKTWTRVVPEPAERSTYVLLSSVMLLLLLFVFWQPMGGPVWQVTTPEARAAIYAVYTAGLLIVLVSTFLINHFDLFGLRQVYLYLRKEEYKPLPFRTPAFYAYVRHPLYVGWLLTFWATPDMTVAHLLFAVMTTVYILRAIQWEERDLVTAHGEVYARYRETVPALIPSRSSRGAAPVETQPVR